MYYKATAVYKRRQPDGEIVEDVREITGTEFLDQASEEVQRAYIGAKARVRLVEDIVGLSNFVEKSIEKIKVELW